MVFRGWKKNLTKTPLNSRQKFSHSSSLNCCFWTPFKWQTRGLCVLSCTARRNVLHLFAGEILAKEFSVTICRRHSALILQFISVPFWNFGPMLSFGLLKWTQSCFLQACEILRVFSVWYLSNSRAFYKILTSKYLAFTIPLPGWTGINKQTSNSAVLFQTLSADSGCSHHSCRENQKVLKEP